MEPLAASLPRGLVCPVGRRTHWRLQIVLAFAGVFLLLLSPVPSSYELLPPELGRLLILRALLSNSGGLRTAIGCEDPAFEEPI